jgi:integrase/recombinase XerD
MKADNLLGYAITKKDPPSRLLSEELTKKVDAFVQDLALQGMAKSSRDGVAWAVRRYLLWASGRSKDCNPSNKDILLDYLADLRAKDLRQSTINRIFSNLSVYFNYLVEIENLQKNPIPAIKKRYIKSYKDEIRRRQLINVEDASKMVRATIDTRDRAILLLFLKTGIRRNELISLDVSDIDMATRTIMLKPTPKRSNRIVFFDDEAAGTLSRWMVARDTRYKKRGEEALFISNKGTRLQASAVDVLVRVAAERVGLHDHASEQLEAKFTPHCCRHWMVTHLLRDGMAREHVKWLRGDSMREAVDIYYHINPDDVRRSYLAHIPQLGV